MEKTVYRRKSLFGFTVPEDKIQFLSFRESRQALGMVAGIKA